MDITLPPDLEAFVTTQVSSGKYASVNAVVLASLQLLVQREKTGQDYVPKTPLGKQLWEIRQRAIASETSLSSAEEIANKLSLQRERA